MSRGQRGRGRGTVWIAPAGGKASQPSLGPIPELEGPHGHGWPWYGRRLMRHLQIRTKKKGGGQNVGVGTRQKHKPPSPACGASP